MDSTQCHESNCTSPFPNITPQNGVSYIEPFQPSKVDAKIDHTGLKPDIERGQDDYEPDEMVFTELNVPRETYLILKYGCETIKGIITICEQDLPNACSLLDDHLKEVLTATSVHIFVAEQHKHLFKDNTTVKTKENTSLNSLGETVTQTHSFCLILTDSSTQESVVEALLKVKSEIYNTCLLIVGTPEEMQLPTNVLISETQSSTVILKDADRLLERCAFRILKQLYLKLKIFENSDKIEEEEKLNLPDIYDMIHASFKRSKIPKTECPDIQEELLPYQDNLEKEAEAIDGKSGIIGYVRKHGKLQIYIEISEDENDVEKAIRRDLQNYDVTQVQFRRRKTKNLCSSGDSLSDESGTLGGFVRKENALPTVSVKDSAPVPMSDAATSIPISNHPLVALVSRHTVQGQRYLIVGRNNRRIGQILPINSAGGNDVLPVDVYDQCRDACDTRFKTEHAARMRATKLVTLQQLEDLCGVAVHIWSERSAPGLGILFRNGLRNRDSRQIIIRDRNRGAPFAQGGDSGAMVCYFDPHHDGGMLYAVAMVVKEMENTSNRACREYTAQILDYALQNLSIQNGCEYKFIENEDDMTE